jgi:hypothetical protein
MLTLRKRPIIKIELRKSNFGMSSFFDGVRFELTEDRYQWVHVSPVTIMAFIEGVLGYALVHQEIDVSYYRRVKRFTS